MLFQISQNLLSSTVDNLNATAYWFSALLTSWLTSAVKSFSSNDSVGSRSNTAEFNVGYSS